MKKPAVPLNKRFSKENGLGSRAQDQVALVRWKHYCDAEYNLLFSLVLFWVEQHHLDCLVCHLNHNGIQFLKKLYFKQGKWKMYCLDMYVLGRSYIQYCTAARLCVEYWQRMVCMLLKAEWGQLCSIPIPGINEHVRRGERGNWIHHIIVPAVLVARSIS